MAANTYGRQVVVPLTNKSGGGVIAGDVVIVDSTNDAAFKTNTASAYTGAVGIAQETIANNAVGRVLLAGYAALVNVNASVTRGNYGITHTVAKQATDGGSSRVVGAFCVFLTGGTSPTAHVFVIPDGSSAAGNVATDSIWDAKGDLAAGTAANTAAKLTVGSNGTVLMAASGEATGLKWSAGGITRTTLGTTSLGGSFDATLKTVYKKITMATDGFIASVSVGVKGQSSSIGDFNVGLMSDNSAVPLIAIAASHPTRTTAAAVLAGSFLINSTARFITFPLGIWVTAADYWIVVQGNASAGNDAQMAYSSGTGSDRTRATTDGIRDESITASSTGTNDYSIYADILR